MKTLSDRRTSSITRSLLILLSITLLLNLFFRSQLYNHSLLLTITLQRSFLASPTFTSLCNLLLTLSDPRLIGLIFLLSSLLFKNKPYILSLLLYFFFCIHTSIILKMLFKDPRPFWTSSVVKNLSDSCHLDYGNPYGATLMPLLVFEAIVVYAAGKGRWGWVGGVGVLGVVGMTGGLAVAGMYLGITALNQILFGVILQVVFMLLFKLHFAKILTSLLYNLNHHTPQCKPMMLKLFAFHLLTLFLPLLIYLLQPSSSLPRTYLINISISC